MIRNGSLLRRTCFESTRRQVRSPPFITDPINMQRSTPLIKMTVSLISQVLVKGGSEYLKFTSLLHRDKKISQAIAMDS